MIDKEFAYLMFSARFPQKEMRTQAARQVGKRWQNEFDLREHDCWMQVDTEDFQAAIAAFRAHDEERAVDLEQFADALSTMIVDRIKADIADDIPIAHRAIFDEYYTFLDTYVQDGTPEEELWLKFDNALTSIPETASTYDNIQWNGDRAFYAQAVNAWRFVDGEYGGTDASSERHKSAVVERIPEIMIKSSVPVDEWPAASGLIRDQSVILEFLEEYQETIADMANEGVNWKIDGQEYTAEEAIVQLNSWAAAAEELDVPSIHRRLVAASERNLSTLTDRIRAYVDSLTTADVVRLGAPTGNGGWEEYMVANAVVEHLSETLREEDVTLYSIIKPEERIRIAQLAAAIDAEFYEASEDDED